MPPEDILIRFSVRDDGTPVIERVNSKFKDTKKNVEGLLPGFEKAGVVSVISFRKTPRLLERLRLLDLR